MHGARREEEDTSGMDMRIGEDYQPRKKRKGVLDRMFDAIDRHLLDR